MVFIYALRLIKGKYYIGKTNKLGFRLDIHFNYEGSIWTKIYKPIEVCEIIPNCDNFDEDKYTIKYMDRYGIKNVRGGSFVSVKLSSSQINFLEQMINGANNRCFNCGKQGHFANNCNINCYSSDSESSDSSKSTSSEEVCYRCGRSSHFIVNCYAKTHINGDILK
jgi:hypothetical protein